MIAFDITLEQTEVEYPVLTRTLYVCFYEHQTLLADNMVVLLSGIGRSLV